LLNIDAQTSLYAVFGDPVGHSLSPVMHNRAFAAAGHNAVYLAFQVLEIGSALAAVRTLGIRGVSVTIPHKIAVMEKLDEIDDTACRIGAVNTVVNRGGRLRGYNSDCEGALRALRAKTAVRLADVAVIGAGGAARAVAFGVKAAGGRLTIINRSIVKGEALARELEADFKPLAELDQLEAGILINTTSVGMSPQIAALPLDRNLLRTGMLVMDVVYNPVKTALLKAAEQAGCTTIDGVDMFVFQGATQFELWTGLQAPIEIMRSAVLEALKPADPKERGK